MAIQSITELRGRISGIAYDRTRTRRRRFRVKSDSPREDVLDIYTAIGIPTGSAYYDPITGFSDPYSVCQGMECEQQENNALYYIATYSYATSPPTSLPEGGETEITLPENREIIVEEYTIKSLIRGDKDNAGNEIKNSAGQPLRDLPEIEKADTAYRVTGWGYTPKGLAWRQSYLNTINNAAWKIFAAKSLKMDDVGSAPEQFNGTQIYRHTYILLHRKQLWSEEFYDLGMMILDNAGKLQPALDKFKQPVTEPVFLDGAGGFNPNNPVPTLLPAVTRIEESNFSAMGLEGASFQA